MMGIFMEIMAVFAIVVLGFALNKTKVLPQEANQYLIPLLMDVASPCVIITSIAGKTLTAELMEDTIVVIVGSLLFFIVTMMVGYGLARAFHFPAADIGVYVCMMNLVNNGFMGFPIAKATFGEDALYLMALCNMVLCAWSYTAGFLQANMGGKKEKGAGQKTNLRTMLNNCSISAVIALIMLFAGIPIPPLIDSVLETVGGMCVPLSMIIVGVQLGESKLGGLILRKDLWVVTIVKLIVYPALIFLVVSLLPISSIAKITLTLSAAFPTAVVTVGVCAISGKNTLLCSEGIAMTTAFSMITLPLTIFILNGVFA